MDRASDPRDSWRAALEWFQGQPMGRRKVELTAIIRPIYEGLKSEPDAEALVRRYEDPNDAEAAMDLARRSYPDNPHLWDLSRTRDVAYGRRLVELERAAAPEA
jgi:hypothetical protein